MSVLFEYCLDIAVRTHKGQKDKLGEPYIFHPIRVSSMLKGEELKCIGLLHDVIEDCPGALTEYDMKVIPVSILHRLSLLTHDKERVSYKDYIKMIAEDHLATKVKIADLMDNTDLDRLDEVYKKEPKTALRIAKKYKWALEYLSGVLEDYEKF
jgi:(p)ppGpp synthase/HD superfamily hydrolase